MPDARTARRDIAAAIDAAAIPDLTAYSEPPDQMSSPAVVLTPGSPYREPSEICTEMMRLNLVVAVPRSAGKDALDEMDDLMGLVKAATDPLGWFFWESVDTIGASGNFGGTEHLLGIVRTRAHLNY